MRSTSCECRARAARPVCVYICEAIEHRDKILAQALDVWNGDGDAIFPRAESDIHAREDARAQSSSSTLYFLFFIMSDSRVLMKNSECRTGVTSRPPKWDPPVAAADPLLTRDIPLSAFNRKY